MTKLSFCIVSSIAAALCCVTPVLAQAPTVVANRDGSCELHYRTHVVHVDNGGTYHQPETRNRASGTIIVPDQTYQCKDGHISAIKQ